MANEDIRNMKPLKALTTYFKDSTDPDGNPNPLKRGELKDIAKADRDELGQLALAELAKQEGVAAEECEHLKKAA